MKQPGLYVVYAAAVRDAAGVNASPGAVLVQDGRVVAAGERGSLPAALVAQAEVIERPNALLLPAMVNAHTHLELTEVGPQPYDPAGGFVGWVKGLRALMANASVAAVESARRGAERSLASGVQAVGNIVESESVARSVFDQGIMGTCFLETFGLGPPHTQDALEKMKQTWLAYQPHAPYSAGPALFRHAAESQRPVTTHLAETLEECEFVGRGTGPWLSYLKEINRWNDAFTDGYGNGLSPVQWMRPYLETAANDGGWLVAHCNYVSDEDIKILAHTSASVAYCPLASEYFGHENHRYREMLAAGINVCLGTDSIVGTDPSGPQPLGLLSAMRRLYERDQTDPQALLAMATTHGARALRLDDKLATLQPGAPARFACLPIDPESSVDPLVQVMTRQDPIEAISFEA